MDRLHDIVRNIGGWATGMNFLGGSRVKRVLLLTLALGFTAWVFAPAGVAAGANEGRHSKKKGACIAVGRSEYAVEALKALNVAWFYSWKTTADAKNLPNDIPFVPMIHNSRVVPGDNPPIFLTLKQQGERGEVRALLGFNEPDQKDQANMTVDEALALWPKLMSTGLRLGSPAGVHADGNWMRQFMQQAIARKYRVDFITVHWYGGPNASSLTAHLQRVYQMYRRPIWITEFAVADWKANTLAENRHTPEQVLQFMKEALPMLERLPYVEAFAWYSGRVGDARLGHSALYDEQGKLTLLGRLYASF